MMVGIHDVSIFSLAPDLKQVVEIPTRKNPDATLDIIITNLSCLYQPAVSLPPLDCDTDKNGEALDHLTILMKPLSVEFQSKKTNYKNVDYRLFPDSAIREMGKWIQSQS